MPWGHFIKKSQVCQLRIVPMSVLEDSLGGFHCLLKETSHMLLFKRKPKKREILPVTQLAVDEQIQWNLSFKKRKLSLQKLLKSILACLWRSLYCIQQCLCIVPVGLLFSSPKIRCDIRAKKIQGILLKCTMGRKSHQGVKIAPKFFDEIHPNICHCFLLYIIIP